jgi:hypothetical protein
VFGGQPEHIGWYGASPLGFTCHIDCRDEDAGDVSMVLDAGIEQLDGPELGQFAIHEAAHGWGLEHVDDRQSIMYRFPATIGASFAGDCTPGAGATYCDAGHAEACPDGGQNADAEVLLRFGPAVVDTTALEARIVFPEDGAVLRPATYGVFIEIDDESAGAGTRLEILELGVALYGLEPGIGMPVELTEPGDYTLVLDVADHDGGLARDEIRVTVDADAQLPSDGVWGCRLAEARLAAVWMLGLFALARRRR